jgi:hypothetical protein
MDAMPAFIAPSDWDTENECAQNLGNVVLGGTNEPSNEPLTNLNKWIGADVLAQLAGVSERMIQKAFKNEFYRGENLDIRTVQTGVGYGGVMRQVQVDSLPTELRDRYYLQHGIDIHAKKAAGKHYLPRDFQAISGFDPAYEAAKKGAVWRLNILRPILETAPRSPQRAAAIDKIAAEGVIGMDQKRETITRVCLYKWLKKYEANGLAGLMRKKRIDVDISRVNISLAWDMFMADNAGRDPQRLLDIGAEIRAYVRGLWAAGVAGWKVCGEQAATRLIEMTRGLHCDAFDALPIGRTGDRTGVQTQFGICAIPRKLSEAERRYVLIAVKDKDNALYQDKYAASIRRDYSQLTPRDIIVGDVHPVDVMMRRADGSMVYPKAISWLDPATNEMHMTFVLCEKGEGIKREHVAQAFEAMVDEWGLPKLLYLDNGSEYKWNEMISGFTMLSKLAGTMNVYDLDTDSHVSGRVEQARESVIRSLAYNAKGKPKIEGAFGNIEQVFFSGIKGWTAGDRMNKKTHLKGRDPVAFQGDATAFLEAASNALAYYHRRPQQGRLNGRSPNEALNGFIENGWGKTVLARKEVMALAFATTETRTVDRGTVQFTPRKGQPIRFCHDDLLILTGQKITIKVPAYKPEYVFCFDGSALICIATPEKSYHPLDTAGAKEDQRRNQYLRRQIAEKRSHCALLSLSHEVQRHIAHLPDAQEAPIASIVRVDILEKMAALADDNRAALNDAQARNRPTEISQWTTDAQNPLLQNVVFLEDEE